MSSIDKPKKGQYVIQDRDSNCGPAAVFNLLIWAGNKRPDIYKLESVSRCEWEYGTAFAGITRMLKHLKLNFRYKKAPQISEMENELDNGGVIIYCYAISSTLNHYVFIPSHTDKSFRVINDLFPGKGNEVDRLRRKSFYASCMSKYQDKPHVWFIRGRKK